METTAGAESVPRELAAVQALVNTVDLEAGDDQLDSPEALRRFLTGHGLLAASEPVGPDDLAMAVELREALRAMLRVNHGEPLDPDALQVVNAASELFGEVFGDAGRHARAAVGVAALPLGVPVEVEAIVEVEA